MTFVPADASVEELREAVTNWQRNHFQAERRAVDAERRLKELSTSCFDSGHFPNPISHPIIGCSICELLASWHKP